MVYGTEVLSLVNTGHKDGILRASEIFNLELNADLMTLSQPWYSIVKSDCKCHQENQPDEEF
jgi:hypothetical protein